MGRHSDPRDTAAGAPESPQDALDAPSGYTDTPETGSDDLSGFLPESMFDPDDAHAWHFEPWLRAVTTVELPEADQ